MGNIGKISVIPKQVSTAGIKTQDTSLRQHGLSRIPGTGLLLLPHKDAAGRPRTGLDKDAKFLSRLSEEEKEIEFARIDVLREKLEEELGVPLGVREPFWKFASDAAVKVQPYKLVDGDNYFDLDDPMQAITFNWLRVHPRIASSLDAYNQGKYPADTQFYVVDESAESALTFKKKASINKAIIRLEDMTPTKRKKVARLMGLPIADSTTDEVVYNHLDSILKQVEFRDGEYRGQSTVELFLRFSEMQEAILNVKDLVAQAITHSIYRVKESGRVFEGEFEIADSKESLVSKLSQDDHQDDRLALENKLSLKKNAAR